MIDVLIMHTNYLVFNYFLLNFLKFHHLVTDRCILLFMHVNRLLAVV